MKKCNYCESIKEDDVEVCCGFSDFTPIVDEVEKIEDPIEEEELFVQPAAHELLVELVDAINLDELEENYVYPDWINDISYPDIQLDAKNRWYAEHPSLEDRIKKYLGI